MLLDQCKPCNELALRLDVYAGSVVLTFASEAYNIYTCVRCVV